MADLITINRMKATLSLRDNKWNGTDKSAPIRVVARSGDPIVAPQIGWGQTPFVHDFSGMRVNGKIPLDYAHDPMDSIGYLSNFDSSSGDLVCSGAIVNVEQGADLIAKLAAGVPYEASIEWGDDYLVEIVDEGQAANVNGQTVQGPVVIYREWDLVAVAVCKFGADGETSTELQLSKKSTKPTKGLFLRSAKGNKQMDTNNTTDNVVATVEVVEEPKGVEPTAKVEAAVTLSQPAEGETVVADATPVVPTVEANKATEAEPVKEMAKAEATFVKIAEPETVTELAKPVAIDPREEAKRFLSTFGNVDGAKYFADGLSFDNAMSKHLTHQASTIAELNKRLAALDRGAEKPVVFQDAEDTNRKQAMSFISIQGKSDDRKGRK